MENSCSLTLVPERTSNESRAAKISGSFRVRDPAGFVDVLVSEADVGGGSEILFSKFAHVATVRGYLSPLLSRVKGRARPATAQ